MPIERHDLIAWHRLRSHLRVCAMAALSLGLIGCSKTPSQPPQQSNPGPNVGSTSEAQRQERAERIRGYFKERTAQKEKEVVATTRTESGRSSTGSVLSLRSLQGRNSPWRRLAHVARHRQTTR